VTIRKRLGSVQAPHLSSAACMDMCSTTFVQCRLKSEMEAVSYEWIIHIFI